MNKKLEMFIKKVKENKDVLIKIGAVVLGAAVGVFVAGLIQPEYTDNYTNDDLEMLAEDEFLDDEESSSEVME